MAKIRVAEEMTEQQEWTLLPSDVVRGVATRKDGRVRISPDNDGIVEIQLAKGDLVQQFSPYPFFVFIIHV